MEREGGEGTCFFWFYSSVCLLRDTDYFLFSLSFKDLPEIHCLHSEVVVPSLRSGGSFQ